LIEKHTRTRINAIVSQFPSLQSDESMDLGFYNEKPTAVTQIIRAKGSFWSADELSEVLCISRKHIYKLAKAGRIPHYRISGSVRFDPEAVAQWLEKRSIN
jgi:excisionase family DNA binding protein